jgi:hypothetical protein
MVFLGILMFLAIWLLFWFLVLWLVRFLAWRYPTWQAPATWLSQIVTHVESISLEKALGESVIIFILGGLLVWGVWSLWPSPHVWNQIMFASVLALVMLGIVTLSIFILRSTRPR